MVLLQNFIFAYLSYSYFFSITDQKIKSQKSIVVKNECWLTSISIFKDSSKILLTDAGNAEMHILDINGGYIKVNRHPLINEPIALCIRSKTPLRDEQIYIRDMQEKGILVFDLNFNFVKNINKDLENIRYMSIDSETDILYISHHPGDFVTVCKADNGDKVNKIQIDQPFDSKIDSDKVYIISSFSGEQDLKKRKLLKLIKGNYINVINKKTSEKIHTINFDCWFDIGSINISNNAIYTIAYKLEANQFYSKNRFLFIISSSKPHQIIRMIELDGLDNFRDAIYLNNNNVNKIILNSVTDKWNDIQIIEFS